MDPKQIAKQMIDFNKTAFDNSFSAMSALQDQTEKLILSFLDKTDWIPKEGKRPSTSGRIIKKHAKILKLTQMRPIKRLQITLPKQKKKKHKKLKRPAPGSWWSVRRSFPPASATGWTAW